MLPRLEPRSEKSSGLLQCSSDVARFSVSASQQLRFRSPGSSCAVVFSAVATTLPHETSLV